MLQAEAIISINTHIWSPGEVQWKIVSEKVYKTYRKILALEFLLIELQPAVYQIETLTNAFSCEFFKAL